MPPAVLDHSLRFFGPERVTFRMRHDRENAEASIRGRQMAVREALETGMYPHHPHNGVYLAAQFRNADEAMPQLFAFLGYVMTLPAYFLSAIGRSCYKAESFGLTRPYFRAATWGLIERATIIRAEWQSREYPGYQGIAIPAWLRITLGPDYIKDFAGLIDEVLARIVELRPAA
jgi:hypothetical protein